jgi:hypothetical protein
MNNKYYDRVNLFQDLVRTESNNIDFYLCEKLLENFIEMNLIYNIINSCTMKDFEVCPCEYNNEDKRLHFIIKAPDDTYINAITSFIDQNNNTIYYGRNKEAYKVNYQPDENCIHIYFMCCKKEG